MARTGCPCPCCHLEGEEYKVDDVLNFPLSCTFQKEKKKGICNIYIFNLVYRMEPKCVNVMFAKTSQCTLGLCTFCLTYLKFKIFFCYINFNSY